MNDEVATKNLPASVDKSLCQMHTLSSLQGDMHDGCRIENALGVLPSMALY